MMNKRLSHLISTPIFAILGRSGGVIILLVIAHVYGATPQTDVFFFISAIIVFLSNLFARFFESALLPYITQYRDQNEKALSISGVALIAAYVVAGLMWLFVMLTFKPFIQYGSGIGENYFGLSLRIFLELSIFMFLGIWGGMADSFFNSYKIFWFPAVSPLIRSIVTLVFVAVGYQRWGIHAVSLGYIAGEIVRLAIAYGLVKKIIKWKFTLSGIKFGQELKNLTSHLSLQVLGIIAVDIFPLVDQWFASWLETGSLSLLNYGDRLILVGHLLFLIGFLQVFLSYWADHYHHESFKAFAQKVNRDIVIVSGVTFAIGGGGWLARGILVDICFGKANLTLSQLTTLKSLVGWMIIGLVPHIINLLYLRVLFVMKKSGLYCACSWVQLVIKIVSSWILMAKYGVVGIAMGTAVTYVLTTLGLHWYVQKEFKTKIRANTSNV